MKKIKFIITVILLCLLSFLSSCSREPKAGNGPIGTPVTEFLAGERLEYLFDEENESYTVIGKGNVSIRDIRIPEEYEGYPITKIADKAFLNCTAIDSLYVGNNIEYIGKSAFECCYMLKKLIIDRAILEIDDSAFKECVNLEEVHIGDGVKKIGDFAFSGCSKISSFGAPAGLEYLGERAFEFCTSLRKATIIGIEEIKAYTFEGCVSLSELYISAERICEGAFYGCEAINELKLNNDVAFIESKAFWGCKNVERINFSENLSELAFDAFEECALICYIELDGENTNFSAIENCLIDNRSKTLVLGSLNSKVPSSGSVKKVGKNAFLYLNELKEIGFDGSKEEWGRLEKEDGWILPGASFAVHCNNGDIKVSNAK